MLESIDLGYTVLRTADKRRLIVPNNIMASQACIDLTLVPPRTCCDVSIYLAAGGDLERARRILLDIGKAHAQIAQVDGCRVARVTSKGVLLTLAASTADPDAAAGVKSDFLESAKKQFDAAGIKIA